MSERSGVDDPSHTVHVPVLVSEVLQWLDLQPGQRVVDGTVGGGGHAIRILERITPGGTLVGLDRDPQMLRLAATRLADDRCRLHQASYADLDKLEQLESPVDRVLLDLGLSSDQLADRSRGFGFDHDGPLDLRFDPSQGRPAWELLAEIDEGALESCLRTWGEERESRRVAGAIVEARRRGPLRTARELAVVVSEAVGVRRESAAGRPGRHPATRVFQALRIAVNDELAHLERALAETLPGCLKSGGKLVVIAFHSLEDRLVKRAFQKQDTWTALTRKPVRPSKREERVNPRCRSARLRTAIRT